jgi:hypothetical protein
MAVLEEAASVPSRERDLLDIGKTNNLDSARAIDRRSIAKLAGIILAPAPNVPRLETDAD